MIFVSMCTHPFFTTSTHVHNSCEVNMFQQIKNMFSGKKIIAKPQLETLIQNLNLISNPEIKSRIGIIFKINKIGRIASIG